MKAPEEKKLIIGDIADYLLEDSGILVSFSKKPRRTIQNISDNVALVKNITNNKPAPLLIFLCNSPIPDKATQKFARAQLPVLYSAMAMIAKPGLSKFIMNLLFRFNKPPIPMKSFTNEALAREWLQQFLH